MTASFDHDPFPGQPKILFIGLAQSSHTHAWVDLLADSQFNVQLFAMPGGLPPESWPVKTYVSSPVTGENSGTRRYLYPSIVGKPLLVFDKLAKRFKTPPVQSPEQWLAAIVRRWQPDIIHTLGMFDDQGGLFYHLAREKYGLQGIGKWILQTRGGSDLALRRHDPELVPVIQKMFTACHQIISDNSANIHYARQIGIPPEKFAPIAPVPGTGGVDIAELSKDTLPPSQRERILLWPKAYESQWSKALPVLEAIQMAWDKIQPCEVYLLAMTPETREWFLTLPEPIRAHCHIAGRIERKEVLALMKRSRVLLIPSLVDGVPNSLYEAMAAGAFPIVSPLDTIQPVVSAGENVLFARNLYPDEISAALVRAMNDDPLVDQAAAKNLALVRKLADREVIRKKVAQYYSSLAS